jgi:hypothetical protein
MPDVVVHLEAADLVCGHTPRKRGRKRRMSLSRALKQAGKAAVAVTAATLNADGSITLKLFGHDDDQHQPNEWDTVQ